MKTECAHACVAVNTERILMMRGGFTDLLSVAASAALARFEGRDGLNRPMLRVARARSIDKPQTSMVIGGSAFPMKAAVIWRMRGQGKGNEMRVISVERENRPTTNLLRRLIRCIRVVVVRVLVGCRRWHRSAEGRRRVCVVVRDG